MIFTKETFEKWYKEIPEKLETITGSFAVENKLKLDYSLASLGALEQWMLKQYDVATDLKEEEDILDMLALYVGETYMRFIGGEWYIELENEKSVFYRRIVVKYEENGESVYRSVIGLCTSSISRKRGNLLSSTLKKDLAKQEELSK